MQMKTDAYTKVILTVIALLLAVLAAQNLLLKPREANAGSQIECKVTEWRAGNLQVAVKNWDVWPPTTIPVEIKKADTVVPVTIKN